MIIRAKTKYLFQGRPLTPGQQENSDRNLAEIQSGATVLRSLPRRLVLELTNACNLNCVMCGRNAAQFRPTMFQMDWLRYFEPMLDTVEEVTLMGWGEPTIHPDFVPMLELIHRHAARIYFCTNGMRLSQLQKAIFDNQVDVFAVSVDGATAETNARVRRGSDLDYIVNNLREIKEIQRSQRLSYPYINFVFCAMRSNLHELPDLVRLAADIGLEEVKAVYLTAFDQAMAGESLWDCHSEVEEVFQEAAELGESLGVALKLPHLQGEDPAGGALHKDCFVAWRDFFLGSDGMVRPCMSTPVQFFPFTTDRPFETLWNAPEYQQYRAAVNDTLKMDGPCRRCYQSSHCNWNRKESFLQMEETFSPDWNKE